ncbi:cation:proton antiporter [Pleionea sp. CnH1-48]|uniref:cation:proton antiporter n=1 Tax=Pleionea sp. CnH1-48 TaxID=2954494 RepID=UPI00209691DF|nr:cation:proton antiporter [Pleionea sp. CnH1-48]MCO7222965.1 cation:proton antiporter [Pleionea sp. CnH1-48]
MEGRFFEELLAVMCTSLAVTVILHRFRLPSIIAYLIAGTLIGPYLLGWVKHPEDFTFLAEFGVVFLLFALGLEFSFSKLMELRSSVFGLGGTQVLSCCLLFGSAVWFWGTSFEAAIVIAGALTLSSTAIVTKELSSQRQVHSRHGQLSIGILLFQDLAAIIFLLLVPVLAGGGEGSISSTLFWAFAKTLALMALLLSIGKWLLPILYKEVAKTQSEEVFVLTTLVIVMLAAWVTHQFHLSMALGGFIIGMMLGENQFRHQINTDIRPFKDILLGLFFVTIGMKIQIQVLFEFWPRIIFFTACLIAFKAALITLLVIVLKHKKETALATGLNLAQAGEFGLALLSLGVMHKLLPEEQASFIILVAIFSMAASPFLIRHSHAIGKTLWSKLKQDTEQLKEADAPVSLPHDGHVIIGGFGRVGKTLAKLLEDNGIHYVAVDMDIDVIEQARHKHHNVAYGDSTKVDMLLSCHIKTAKMAILTFGSAHIAKETVSHIRSAGIKTPIIARCYEQADAAELKKLGADYVIPEMLEASLAIGHQLLTLLDLKQEEIEEQLDQFRKEELKTS